MGNNIAAIHPLYREEVVCPYSAQEEEKTPSSYALTTPILPPPEFSSPPKTGGTFFDIARTVEDIDHTRAVLRMLAFKGVLALLDQKEKMNHEYYAKIQENVEKAKQAQNWEMLYHTAKIFGGLAMEITGCVLGDPAAMWSGGAMLVGGVGSFLAAQLRHREVNITSVGALALAASALGFAGELAGFEAFSLHSLIAIKTAIVSGMKLTQTVSSYEKGKKDAELTKNQEEMTILETKKTQNQDQTKEAFAGMKNEEKVYLTRALADYGEQVLNAQSKILKKQKN